MGKDKNWLLGSNDLKHFTMVKPAQPLQIGQEFEYIFSKEDIETDTTHIDRYSTSIFTKEICIKNIVRYYFVHGAISSKL